MKKNKLISFMLIIAMLISMFPTVVFASPVTTSTLYSITENDGKYVMVGASGTIVTSDDLVAFTKQVSGTMNTLNDVTYGNSLYVAVGATNTILTSPDATTWTSRAGATATFNAVAYGNNKYVAVGDAGKIYTSSNGTSWTAQTSNTSSKLNDVIWDGNMFVAVGASGTALASPDGVTWYTQTTGYPASNFNAIIFDGQNFSIVADEGQSFFTMPTLGQTDFYVDPTWQPSVTNISSNIYSIAYNGSRYVASALGEMIYKNSIAGSWTKYTNSGTNYDIIWDGTQFLNVGANGKLQKSITGTTWTVIPLEPAVTYTITFNTGVANASVTFNGESKTANASGTAVFSNVAPGSKNYTVSKAGYIDVAGTIYVNGNVTENVTMEAIPPETYTVTFTVTDGTNPVSGAISFAGQNLTTNASGQAVFSGVEEAYGVSYTVTATGFLPSSGTIDVNSNIEKSIVLTAEPEAPVDTGNNTLITGTILPTIIEFTLPTTVNFTLNPSGTTEEERFIAPDFTFVNDSNAPLDIDIANFIVAPDSPHIFEDVLPDEYTDAEWNKMNSSNSQSKIAISIHAKDQEEWRNLANADKIYAKAVQDNGLTPLGSVDPKSTVTLSISAKHGNAFREVLNAKYVVSMVFSLSD